MSSQDPPAPRPPSPGQGTNSTAVRRLNERRLLTALRRLGEASKSDLSGQLSITQNAVGQIVHELQQRDLVSSVGRRQGQRGQPAALLRLNPDGAYAIGIKIGSRSTRSLLVDFTGRILHSRRVESLAPDPVTALKLARAGAAAALRALPPARRDRLTGIGLVLSSDLFSSTDHPQANEAAAELWQQSDVPGELRRALGGRLLVERAGVAVALSELFLGHGREIDDFASLYIDSSISGGLVLRGDYRNSGAGGIGLVPVPRSALLRPRGDAPRHRRGAPVRLRDRASGSSLFRHLAANGVVPPSAVDLHAVLVEHPHVVGQWLDDSSEALLTPLLSLLGVLDLQAVVLDGNLPRPLVAELCRRLQQLLTAAWPQTSVALRLGSAGSQAAALGAALLPLHVHHQQA